MTGLVWIATTYFVSLAMTSNDERVIMQKQGFVYILFSKPNGTLYVGVTSDLIKRVYEHKQKFVSGFTQKYNVDKLGYYEVCENIQTAIMREKQLKAGKRQTKIDLIISQNPQWKDLYESLF